LTPREWDAAAYDYLARPQSAWGTRILERLELKGDEVVLEAGCGTGRDTARLLDRLPRGRVIALDGSKQMLDVLKRRLEGRLDRVETVQADLSLPLDLSSPVDLVFSVAAFHWIPDHDGLFRNLAAVMRPGARLAADCGGRGNIDRVSRAIEEVTGVPGERGIWNFAGPEETRSRLAAAGFSNIQVELHGEPFELPTRADLELFLRTVILGSHLARTAPEERDQLVSAVADRLPDRRIDYTRLTISALLLGVD
jgi:trans-aconitate 2-methyltransferase